MSGLTVKKTTVSLALIVQMISLLLMLVLGNTVNSVVVGLGMLTITILFTGLINKELSPSIEQLVESRVSERTSNLVAQMSEYEQQAITDALTGLLNRRGGEESIANHISRSRRLLSPVSFLLIDIDKFKDFNDTYGHAIGDSVLVTVSSCLKSNIRTSDVAIRWGGEEFLICLPDTDLQGAYNAGEKLRKNIELIEIQNNLKVTVSMGCAELGSDTFQIALARADLNLYLAKSQGRNRVFPDFPQNNLDRF